MVLSGVKCEIELGGGKVAAYGWEVLRGGVTERERRWSAVGGESAEGGEEEEPSPHSFQNQTHSLPS